ncbi:MAG: hypothetical protein V3V67_08365 [Myxococcota bacterium]
MNGGLEVLSPSSTTRAALILFALLPLLVSGCYLSPQSRSLVQRSVAARELYREPEFVIERLEREGATSLAARLSFGNETYGQALGQGLIETLRERLDGGILHPNLAASRINAAGLAESYARMLDSYDQTNILDRDVLRELADAVEVRYFAVPILLTFREASNTRFSVFGLRLGKTTSANARIQLQIWDGESGRVAWEGISDLTLAQETFREGPIRFEDTVLATWQSLIDEIPSAADAVVSRDD